MGDQTPAEQAITRVLHALADDAHYRLCNCVAYPDHCYSPTCYTREYLLGTIGHAEAALEEAIRQGWTPPPPAGSDAPDPAHVHTDTCQSETDPHDGFARLYWDQLAEVSLEVVGPVLAQHRDTEATALELAESYRADSELHLGWYRAEQQALQSALGSLRERLAENGALRDQLTEAHVLNASLRSDVRVAREERDVVVRNSDKLRAEVSRLSAGSPTIPDDVRVELWSYLSSWLPEVWDTPPVGETFDRVAESLAACLVDDVLSGWSAATPKADGTGEPTFTVDDMFGAGAETAIAEGERDALASKLAEATWIIDAGFDSDPCSLDHNGNCQAHGWFPFDSGRTECYMARAKRFLDAVPPSGATDPAPAPTEGGPRWSPGDYVEYDCEWHGRTVAIPGFVTGDAYPATGGVHRMTVQTGRLMVGEVYMADTALRVPRTVTEYCGAFDVDVPDVSMKPCQEKALPQSNRCARHAEDVVLLAVAEDRALHDTGGRHDLDTALADLGVDEAPATPTEDGPTRCLLVDLVSKWKHGDKALWNGEACEVVHVVGSTALVTAAGQPWAVDVDELTPAPVTPTPKED